MAYTFKRHTWTEYEANDPDGLNLSGVDWCSQEWGVLAESDEEAALAAAVATAGWRITEQTGVGILTRRWWPHPFHALIVSDDMDPGLGFCVSNEPHLGG